MGVALATASEYFTEALERNIFVPLTDNRSVVVDTNIPFLD